MHGSKNVKFAVSPYFVEGLYALIAQIYKRPI